MLQSDQNIKDLPANEASGDVFLLTHSKSSSIEGLLYSPNTVINHHYQKAKLFRKHDKSSRFTYMNISSTLEDTKSKSDNLRGFLFSFQSKKAESTISDLSTYTNIQSFAFIKAKLIALHLSLRVEPIQEHSKNFEP